MFSINWVDFFLHVELRTNTSNFENTLIFMTSLFWSDGLLRVSTQTILGIGGDCLKKVEIPNDNQFERGICWNQKCGLRKGAGHRKSIWQNPTSIQRKKQNKTLSHLKIKGSFLNLVKCSYQNKEKQKQKPTGNPILNSERLNAFPPKSGTSQGYLLSLLLFNAMLEVPELNGSHCNKARKRNKQRERAVSETQPSFPYTAIGGGGQS